jgi:hypothetical protein
MQEITSATPSDPTLWTLVARWSSQLRHRRIALGSDHHPGGCSCSGFFMLPTATYHLLLVLEFRAHEGRRAVLVHLAVTARPTAHAR